MNVRDLLLSLLLGIFLAVVLSAVLRPIIRRALLNSNLNPMSTGNSLQRTISVPLPIPVIASLLTEYYDLLISLAYFSPDEISFPPHTIDIELSTRLNLSAAVIETMRSIPFPRTYHISFCNPVYPCSRAFVFTDPEDIVASRDPCMPLREAGYDEDFAGPPIPPYILPLGKDMVMDTDYNGWIMLLDTRTGTIRPWGDGAPKLPNDQQLPKDGTLENDNHYRNWPTRPAEEVLGEMIESLRTLKWVPMVKWGRRGIFFRERGFREWKVIRETLFNMGWATNKWDTEEWNRVKERVLEE
jgi:hypothetical protein